MSRLVSHTWNGSTGETEAGASEFKLQTIVGACCLTQIRGRERQREEGLYLSETAEVCHLVLHKTGSVFHVHNS